MFLINDQSKKWWSLRTARHSNIDSGSTKILANVSCAVSVGDRIRGHDKYSGYPWQDDFSL